MTKYILPQCLAGIAVLLLLFYCPLAFATDEVRPDAPCPAGALQPGVPGASSFTALWPVTPLRMGEQVDAVLVDRGIQVYTFPAQPGQAFELLIDQEDVDILATVVNSDESRAPAINFSTWFSQERIPVRAMTGGCIRLELQPSQAGDGGRYRVSVVEFTSESRVWRETIAGDQLLQQALAPVLSGVGPTREARIQGLLRALEHYRGASVPSRVARVLELLGEDSLKAKALLDPSAQFSEAADQWLVAGQPFQASLAAQKASNACRGWIRCRKLEQRSKELRAKIPSSLGVGLDAVPTLLNLNELKAMLIAEMNKTRQSGLSQRVTGLMEVTCSDAGVPLAVELVDGQNTPRFEFEAIAMRARFAPNFRPFKVRIPLAYTLAFAR